MHNGRNSSHVNRPVMSRSVTDNGLRTRGQGGRMQTGGARGSGGNHTHWLESSVVTNHTHKGHIDVPYTDHDGYQGVVQFAGEVYEQASLIDGQWETDGWDDMIHPAGSHAGHRNYR